MSSTSGRNNDDKKSAISATSGVKDNRSHVSGASGTRGHDTQSAVSGSEHENASSHGGDHGHSSSSSSKKKKKKSHSSGESSEGGGDASSSGAAGGANKKAKEPQFREFQVLDPNPTAAANTKTIFASNAVTTSKIWDA